MADVRKRLGLKSIAWKSVAWKVERIRHVLQMRNDRLTKALVLGWYECLKGIRKLIGKRKTVLYWKMMLREAGVMRRM